MSHASPTNEQVLYAVHNRTRETVLASRALAANDSRTRREGLLKRTEFLPGEGLLITPCEAIHTFGMKFAIDVVFMDRKRVVRKIAHAVPKRRIAFCFTAEVALELPAGTAEATGTRPGDQLVLERIPGEESPVHPDAQHLAAVPQEDVTPNAP